jgi:hypothetical protein
MRAFPCPCPPWCASKGLIVRAPASRTLPVRGCGCVPRERLAHFKELDFVPFNPTDKRTEATVETIRDRSVFRVRCASWVCHNLSDPSLPPPPASPPPSLPPGLSLPSLPA